MAGDDDGTRPWHGTTNPFEALYQHFTAEIAALKAGQNMPAQEVPVPPAAVQPEQTPSDPRNEV